MGWRARDILVTAGLLAALSSPVAAQTSREIEHQGVKRAVIVSNADAAKEAPKPLLIVLHGRRSPEEPHRASRLLDVLAAREEFVVAYPAGVNGRWDYPEQPADTLTIPGKDGSLDLLPDRSRQPADDVGFVVTLIERLVSERIADRNRIYVSGASNGGLLTYGLMCLTSDRLAAAAVLIANMSEAQMAACKPARAVPAVFVAGTADRIMPYDGMITPTGHRLASVPETLEFWRKRHGCRAQLVARPQDPKEPRATNWSRIDLNSCDGTHPGVHLRFFRIEGGGHTLPSLSPQSPEDLAKNGRRSADFETSVEVWSFLKQWSLP